MNTTVPGPLTFDHNIVNTAGGPGSPSSLALPRSRTAWLTAVVTSGPGKSRWRGIDGAQRNPRTSRRGKNVRQRRRTDRIARRRGNGTHQRPAAAHQQLDAVDRRRGSRVVVETDGVGPTHQHGRQRRDPVPVGEPANERAVVSLLMLTLAVLFVSPLL